MVRDRVAELTERFLAWELRGRGWRVWDKPVRLEPPFEAFEAVGFPAPAAVPDDGRRPHPVRALVGRLLRLGHRDDEQPDVTEVATVPEPPTAAAEPAVELRLIAPPDLVVTPALAEQLLCGSLGSFSWEIVGTGTSIVVQVTVPASREALMRQALLGHFPSLAIERTTEPLASLWQATGARLIVDFGLGQECMRPLIMPRSYRPDPLLPVLAALETLGAQEVGIVQILVEPVEHPWAESLRRATVDLRGRPFFVDAPELPKQAAAKTARPLLAVVVRLAVGTATDERALELARSVAAGFRVLADPTGNELAPLANDGRDPEAHEDDLLTRRSHRSGMLLNTAELAALVHPPSESVAIPRLIRQTRKTKAVRPAPDGAPLVLGFNRHAGVAAPVALSEAERSQHAWIVGGSGTGKSTLLVHLITQSITAGDGVGVIDPHGDLVDEILTRIPDTRVPDVIILDPSDVEFPVAVNVLAAHSELEKTLMASDLVAVFRRLSTSWGDVMDTVLANAILAFLESSSGGTLLDLRRFLLEPPFRAGVLATVGDPEVRYYWQKIFPLLRGKPQGPIVTRLDALLRPRMLRNMLAQPTGGLDIGDVMDSGKILLVKLAQGAIGEENAALLGAILVSKFQQLAMSRQEQKATERRPFHLFIDEFHHVVCPTMSAILSGARKYKLALTLAHQDLQQLRSRDEDTLSSVTANAYTRICFRLGDADARLLESSFAGFDRTDLMRLETGQAIVRLGRADHDCNLDVPLPPSVDAVVAEKRTRTLVALSRQTHARPWAEVEAEYRTDAQPVADAPPGPDPHAPEAAVETEAIRKESGAVSAERGRPSPVKHPARVDPQTPEPAPVEAARAPSPLVPGRGGPQHKYLQELTRRWAGANDWAAVVEEDIADGGGRVDVALRKGEYSVACEISISTTAAHEVGNIEKCLAAGFDRVVVVGLNRRAVGKIETAFRSAHGEAETEGSGRVDFVTADELLAHLADVAANLDGPKTVRGYAVSVRYTSKDAGNKRDAVAAVIARSLGRLKPRRSDDGPK